MNFEYSQEQQLIKDSVTKFMADNYDFERRQKVVAGESVFSAEIWQKASELGWLSLPFSGEQGGLDGSPVETMLFFEEFGKHLVVEPFLETLVLFGGVLRRAAFGQSAELVGKLIEGQLQGALAHFEPQSRGDLANINSLAIEDSEGYLISGHKAVVYNAAAADMIIVSAKINNTDRLGLFLVPAISIHAQMKTYDTVDGRSAAEIILDALRVSDDCLLAEGNDASEIIEAVFDEALLALSAESVGAMDALLKATMTYTKERKQFGDPISKFQVSQHRMANMFMSAELARSLVLAAAIKLRDGSVDARKYVAAAKVKADKAAQFVAHSAIQLHGGIATTEELSIGHYLKRITVTNNIFGSTRFHVGRYQRMAELSLVKTSDGVS